MPPSVCGICLKAGHQPYQCATVDVFDKYGRRHAIRVVLDCASHLSFIRKDLCDRLGIEKSPIDLDFQGISAASSHANMGTSVTVASRCSNYRTTIPCAVLDRISADLPLRPVDISDWPIPDSVYLADPQFHHPGKISLLLGLQPFLDFLEPGRINLDTDGRFPILQNTKLGWVVSGRYEAINSTSTSSACLITSPNKVLSHQLQRFFEIEEYINPEPHFSEEERNCETHFEQNTVRDQSGCFEVRLPFRENPSSLGASRDIAVKRLGHIERKLNRSPSLKTEYHAFLREYLNAGHMSLAEIPSPKGAVYLPHHCVLKESSSTTKCRVVFDASSKTASGKSLNDVLMTGPVLQDSLINILLRFRIPAIALTGDIRQMYRMVKISASDRDYQRILWRWKEEDPIVEYTLNTVKASVILGYKMLPAIIPPKKHNDCDNDFPNCLLLGVFISASGHHSSALEGVPEADLEVRIPIELHEDDTIKALGIHWQPCSDEFLFSYQPYKSFQPTKRIILSQIVSLFNPLGLLAPVIVMAKLVMRELWELQVDWDETPPGELIINDWLTLAQNLSSLNSFQIPRRVIDPRALVRLFLRGYSDASERAMGACIYVRSIDKAGNRSSQLLCAKSKIAPIGNNRSTIPRLELHSAVMLAKLINNVSAALQIQFHEIRAYSDSQVVLAWIAGGASKWKT
ncbi:uncharacterized protein LOC128745826 [Sabethes cyaneus]|uniref:uncharacterized protein LOC128745826 n=1 Tax=Sabethes cyaneus TaxID=53552 RepID=UPI00237DDA74|nr:uncharacterized protein LOC128745826 [Sabethes cyaneus]